MLSSVLGFVHTLRHRGVVVRAGGVPDAVCALDLVGIRRRRDVREALRAVLLSRHEDQSTFDECFDRFWRARRELADPSQPMPMQVPSRARTSVRLLAPAAASAADEASDRIEEPVARSTYSADEVWRRKDFAALTSGEAADAEAAVEALAWDPGLRRTRRWQTGTGSSADLRRLVRANLKHGGEPVVIPRRERRVVPRPLVMISDVSGSMEPYSRMLLVFARALLARRRRVEVFVFSTRLTRITRQLFGTAARAALPRVRDAVRDWSGGTRIGDAVHAFNVHWARRVLRRRPVVLLISDGWDLGDPKLLAREMARLQRSVFRLIWLNPLIGSPGYAPLTRGMQAALPFVDDFLSARNLSSLEAVAGHLNALATVRSWN